jgi:hypothetical protein
MSAKRPRKNTSASLAWFTERSVGPNTYTWSCRVANCPQPPYTFKSTTTFINHLRDKHDIDCKTQSPATQPHLLRAELAGAVLAARLQTAPLLSSSSSSSSSSPSASNSAKAALSTTDTPSTGQQQTIYSAFHAANNPKVRPAQAKLFAKQGLSHRLADSTDFDDFIYAFRSSTMQPLRRGA